MDSIAHGNDGHAPDATVAIVKTDAGPLAERAADVASQLYVQSEHERRQSRFDRAIRRAHQLS